jgi:hypothetical protein
MPTLLDDAVQETVIALLLTGDATTLVGAVGGCGAGVAVVATLENGPTLPAMSIARTW